MQQVEVKFTASGCSAVTGNFAPGDLLRTSPEMARHLVKDARCAEYTQAGADDKPVVKAKPTKSPKRAAEGDAP